MSTTAVKTNTKIGGIKRAIENHIATKNGRSQIVVLYGNWYCGVTNDETRRKADHKYGKNISALYFKAWDAESKDNALLVEKHFHQQGMKGLSKSPGGVRSSSKYVYIFKRYTTIADDIAAFFESNE